LLNPIKDSKCSLAFSVIRVPFFLEPNYDESKTVVETNRERLIRKWGGSQGWERQKKVHNLKQRGLDVGISHFNLDRLASNTMASHRLIQSIGKKYGLGISEAVYDLLNEYYFVEGHSLNDRPRLAHCVAKKLKDLLTDSSQMPTEEEILEFLNRDEGRQEIEHALAALKILGIHGIPKFIIEGTTVVDGAAGYETFVSIFRDIERRGSLLSGPIFADILGISSDTLLKGSHHPPVESS
jgi:predicted DsbA family dithiol-disulfide isomerase